VKKDKKSDADMNSQSDEREEKKDERNPKKNYN
jgi:hypothetical protein